MSLYPITWIPVHDEIFYGLPYNNHLSIVTYYRLIIPDAVPMSVGKIIYLDCDLMFQGDIADLWQVEPGNNYLMAVQGYGSKRLIATSPLAKCNVSHGSDDPYFNAGILLLNLKLFRSEKIHRNALQFIRKYASVIRNADQDGLNAVSIKRWGKLDPIWNQFTRQGGGYKFQWKPGGIIHFTSPNKPWMCTVAEFMSGDMRFVYQKYQHYIKQSGWLSKREWFFYVLRRFAYQILNRIRSYTRPFFDSATPGPS